MKDAQAADQPPYHYFDLKPPGDDAQVLTLQDAKAAIQNHFAQVEFDEEAALDNARRRHDALARLGAPEKLVGLYKNPKVVRVFITNPELDGHYIEFDLWHKQGVLVYPKPDETKLSECEALARELASVLGYDCSIMEYD